MAIVVQGCPIVTLSVRDDADGNQRVRLLQEGNNKAVYVDLSEVPELCKALEGLYSTHYRPGK